MSVLSVFYENMDPNSNGPMSPEFYAVAPLRWADDVEGAVLIQNSLANAYGRDSMTASNNPKPVYQTNYNYSPGQEAVPQQPTASNIEQPLYQPNRVDFQPLPDQAFVSVNSNVGQPVTNEATAVNTPAYDADKEAFDRNQYLNYLESQTSEEAEITSPVQAPQNPLYPSASTGNEQNLAYAEDARRQIDRIHQEKASF